MKLRLDKLLLERNLADSREKARAMIMAGQVLVNQLKVEKAGSLVDSEAQISITGKKLAYVSRGGLKLEKALEEFPIDLKGKIVADLGASTGGFTDCALQKGAAKVYAIDVGYGQLDWKLRNDQRVEVLERTNARYLEEDSLLEKIDFVTADLAFISLTKILPAIRKILKKEGQALVLIKPQFEAGRENIEKKGVVKDPAVHVDVINKVIDFAIEEGFIAKGLTFSPIKGPEGNIEYLLWLLLPPAGPASEAGQEAGGAVNPKELVSQAFEGGSFA